ncbi:universal stress protein [Roseomonas sp. GC11]|uniref:universal stress protein n=1 Tax=Roseomonas sp. GC11 TaxID=2950546 RepID=UPI00210EAC73|nr:universal stress protein [Roseomonas sp. GC11]MCQ4159814.1 universal stress protein [Roseomonas sp. GC11]
MTQLKDILVHLDGTEASALRLRLAAGLARRHGAHLAGLFVIDVAWPVFAGEGASANAVSTVLGRMRDEAQERAREVEALFRETLRREAVEGEWRLGEGETASLVALHARYADLVVLGQTQPGGPPLASAVLEEVLFTSGRPLLVVPYAGRFNSLGERVLIGWNASREAARAVNDALPLIAAASTTTVLAINPRRGEGGHGAEPGADIALHLARHGLKVEVENIVAAGISEADTLLNRAAELGADLMILGGYGHSRLREMVLGGVTRSLLQSMTVPILLSH